MCHETLFHFCMPVGEKILRTVAVYAFLVIGLRLAGKRELGQFTSFDLVVLITIANALQNAIIGPESSLSGGVIGGAVLLAANIAVAHATYRSRVLDRILTGRASVLFQKGHLDQKACRRERITEADIMAAVRREGVYTLDEVERIVLETSGYVSVIPKEDAGMRQILNEIRELKRLVSERAD